MAEYLLLKWGTLKGWKLESEASKAAAQKYVDFGMSGNGAMMQHDVPDQKTALCELIDSIDGEILNDWSGDVMTKDQAKDYVLSYGKK